MKWTKPMPVRKQLKLSSDYRTKARIELHIQRPGAEPVVGELYHFVSVVPGKVDYFVYSDVNITKEISKEAFIKVLTESKGGTELYPLPWL